MSLATRVRKTASYLRWMLKAPRYAGKALRTAFGGRRPTTHAGIATLPTNELFAALQARGFGQLQDARFELPEVDTAALAGRAKGMPFYNALPLHWESFKPLICSVLREPRIVDTLLRYFDGKPWLWNVALNFSEASEGERDSQLWHFDYGDVRQLHVMVYLSDVEPDCGPFTFFPSEVSDRVSRSPISIERFSDEDLRRRFGIDAAAAMRLTGRRGDCFVNDPGRTLHQGARCRRPRLVLFLSFTTPTPMSVAASKTLPGPERLDLFRHYAALGPPIFREAFFV